MYPVAGFAVLLQEKAALVNKLYVKLKKVSVVHVTQGADITAKVDRRIGRTRISSRSNRGYVYLVILQH